MLLGQVSYKFFARAIIEISFKQTVLGEPLPPKLSDVRVVFTLHFCNVIFF